MNLIERCLPKRALIALFLVCALAVSTSAAVSLKTSAGAAHSGEIALTAAKTVFLRDAFSNLTLLKKPLLDAESLALVEAWEGAHPDNSHLATKFDQTPQVVKKRIPKRDQLSGVKSAVIMLALLIDETGAVEEVLVKDSSDKRVVEPTCDALSYWRFKPLIVDSTPRRGVVFMPIQF